VIASPLPRCREHNVWIVNCSNSKNEILEESSPRASYSALNRVDIEVRADAVWGHWGPPISRPCTQSTASVILLLRDSVMVASSLRSLLLVLLGFFVGTSMDFQFMRSPCPFASVFPPGPALLCPNIYTDIIRPASPKYKVLLPTTGL